MKFSDIDFGALKHMVDSLTDDEKESLSNMARNLAQNMPDSMNQAAENLQHNLEETDDPVDYIEYLQIPAWLADELDGHTLSMLESGSDMEQYYSDIEEADLSASVLFYDKALLSLSRLYLAPLLKEKAGLEKFSKPAQTTLYDYAWQLGQEDVQKKLADDKTSAEAFAEIGQALMHCFILLQRAEFETIGKRDVEVIKSLMSTEGLLERLYKLKSE